MCFIVNVAKVNEEYFLARLTLQTFLRLTMEPRYMGSGRGNILLSIYPFIFLSTYVAKHSTIYVYAPPKLQIVSYKNHLIHNPTILVYNFYYQKKLSDTKFKDFLDSECNTVDITIIDPKPRSYMYSR